MFVKDVKNIKTYQLIIPSMEVVSVPETSLVASNVTDLAPLVLEVRLPHQ